MPPPPRFIEIANRLFVVTDIAGVVFEPIVVRRYPRVGAKLQELPVPRLEYTLRVVTQRGAETKADGSYAVDEADTVLARIAAELRTAGINHVHIDSACIVVTDHVSRIERGHATGADGEPIARVTVTTTADVNIDMLRSGWEFIDRVFDELRRALLAPSAVA
jgi:hypothetical protein